VRQHLAGGCDASSKKALYGVKENEGDCPIPSKVVFRQEEVGGKGGRRKKNQNGSANGRLRRNHNKLVNESGGKTRKGTVEPQPATLEPQWGGGGVGFEKCLFDL